MDSLKQKEGDVPTVPPEMSTSSQPSNPKASSPAPSTTSSTGRPPYMPQFSAATQMILKRINSKPGSLSSALSSASSELNKTNIEKSTFEDAKRRLVMTMNTSMSMRMPPQIPHHHTMPRKSSSMVTLRMPMDAAFQLRTPAPTQTTAAPPISSAKTIPKTMALAKPATPKASTQKSKSKPSRGTKRKRGKEDDGDETSSSLSDLSDNERKAAPAANTTKSSVAAASAKEQAVHTMTKYGRQVQKPTQYNPSLQSARDAQKRKTNGKRTQEQALCKVCQRGLSPNANQIVFCDGCNNGWHQMCHEPYIDDDFVSNESQSWFCNRCVAKREKHIAKKKKLEGFKGVSWSGKTAEQKRSYLSGVPHAQLVNIIMYSMELHPELPIFPAHEARRGGAQGARTSSNDSSRTKTDSNINVGPTHYSSKVSTPDSYALNAKATAGQKSATDSQDRAAREGSSDSVPAAWPQVGKGTLAGLEMKEDEMRDKNDHEAFSVSTYNARGKKIIENGKAA